MVIVGVVDPLIISSYEMFRSSLSSEHGDESSGEVDAAIEVSMRQGVGNESFELFHLSEILKSGCSCGVAGAKHVCHFEYTWICPRFHWLSQFTSVGQQALYFHQVKSCRHRSDRTKV